MKGNQNLILIAIGANLPTQEFGAPVNACEAAVDAIEKAGLEVIKRSRWYRTAPVPISDQPWYVNGVVSVRSSLSPLEVMAILHGVEKRFGRVRSVTNAPRVIDLDLLAHGDSVFDEGLCVPHPRLHERAFVLLPLRDVDNGWRHPKLGKSVLEMIDALPAGQKIEVME